MQTMTQAGSGQDTDCVIVFNRRDPTVLRRGPGTNLRHPTHLAPTRPRPHYANHRDNFGFQAVKLQ